MTVATRECVSAVDRGLDALRGRWLGGWELIRATGRDNANAVARDCHQAAKRRGLTWHYLSLNDSDAGPGCKHRVWCVTRRNERPPHHPAQDAGAEVVSDPPVMSVNTELLARSATEIAERRRALCPPSLSDAGDGGKEYPRDGGPGKPIAEGRDPSGICPRPAPDRVGEMQERGKRLAADKKARDRAGRLF